MARRVAKLMAVALGKRRNAVHGRGQANPQGAAVASRSRVAALAKGYGHYLRTASCCETPQQRWIRNYHVEGALGVTDSKQHTSTIEIERLGAATFFIDPGMAHTCFGLPAFLQHFVLGRPIAGGILNQVIAAAQVPRAGTLRQSATNGQQAAGQ